MIEYKIQNYQKVVFSICILKTRFTYAIMPIGKKDKKFHVGQKSESQTVPLIQSGILLLFRGSQPSWVSYRFYSSPSNHLMM